MKKIIIILVIFLSSCYTYPGKYCPDDVYYSIPRENRMTVINQWGYAPFIPYYPFYRDPVYYNYYTPPRVNVYIPAPTPALPPQPRRIVTSPQPKKTEQNNNQHSTPIRKFNK